MAWSRKYRSLHDCRPTPEQERLLKAALSPIETARTQYQEWHRDSGGDQVQLRSFKFLPFLYPRAAELEIVENRRAQIEELYRGNQLRNLQLLNTVSVVLEEINAAGIPVIALKGLVLTEHYYQDRGLRFVEDFDFMVPVTQVERTVRILVARGWQSAEQLSPETLRKRTGLSLQNATGQKIDLHWHLVNRVGLVPQSPHLFWAQSVQTTLADVPCRILSPTDQLFHIAINGLRRGSPPRLVWVADALMILKKQPIDWNRLLLLAANFEQTLLLAAALNYLRDNFDASIPQAFLAELCERTISQEERLSFLIWVREARGGIFSRLRFFYVRFEYKRRTGDLAGYFSKLLRPYRGTNALFTFCNVALKTLSICFRPKRSTAMAPRNAVALPQQSPG
jgi:hypothetical protein